MKKILAAILFPVLILALLGCGQQTPSQDTAPGNQTSLTIFAAASLTQPLNEVISAYQATAPDVTITANYGASGALQTQIEQGAPADIFFSAAAKQMDALDQGGLILTSTRVDLLKNEIVLVVPKDLPVKVGSFSDLSLDAGLKIAVGDPESVPAGQYARETFTFLNIWDQISSQAAYGADVKQVLSWVDSGNVDCGVVYKSDALTDEKVKITAEAPNGSHSPIVYPAAVVKASTNQDSAKAFLKYLQQDSVISVFTKYGFSAG